MTTGVIAYVVNQTHKFFSAFCPRRAHTFLDSNFPLSREKAWESFTSCEGRRQRVSVVVSHFPHRLASVFATRLPSGFRICAVEPSLSSLTHSSSTAAHLCVAPRAPKWPTWHATSIQRKTFIYHHGNRVAFVGHAVATREEKSGRFISQKGAR